MFIIARHRVMNSVAVVLQDNVGTNRFTENPGILFDYACERYDVEDALQSVMTRMSQRER